MRIKKNTTVSISTQSFARARNARFRLVLATVLKNAQKVGLRYTELVGLLLFRLPGAYDMPYTPIQTKQLDGSVKGCNQSTLL